MHQLHEVCDRVRWSLWENTVPEVENVPRTSTGPPQDVPHSSLEIGPRGK